ncbi:MAG: hypothetical protein ACLTEH_06615 [Clostridia bacterium]
MSEDMSDMMQKLSGMLAGKEVPDNIKSMLQNFTANKSSESTSSTTSPEEEAHTTDSSNESGNTETSNPFGNIDIGTIMKMKSIMDKMNQKKDDPRSNLLLSLKPYLKPSRKQKVDQYIQLFSMTEILEAFNSTGGEKKQ